LALIESRLSAVFNCRLSHQTRGKESKRSMGTPSGLYRSCLNPALRGLEISGRSIGQRSAITVPVAYGLPRGKTRLVREGQLSCLTGVKVGRRFDSVIRVVPVGVRVPLRHGCQNRPAGRPWVQFPQLPLPLRWLLRSRHRSRMEYVDKFPTRPHIQSLKCGAFLRAVLPLVLLDETLLPANMRALLKA